MLWGKNDAKRLAQLRVPRNQFGTKKKKKTGTFKVK